MIVVAMLLVTLLGIAGAIWWRYRSPAPANPRGAAVSRSRRVFLAKAAAVGVAATTTVLIRPMAAYATHKRCNHSGAKPRYGTCVGRCSTRSSSCCATSPNGVYRDCVTAGCFGRGCSSQPRRVVFNVDNTGGCHYNLRLC